jgi:HrpA-like RNA helicase
MNDNIIDYNIGIFDPEGKNPNPLNGLPYSDTYKNLSKFWSNLPAYLMSKDIVQSVLKNDVILIISSTGSGKSLLIPKLCLHSLNYKGHIIMTLPKKLITKATAEFAAKTLDVELGEQVGYQFRGENMKSANTLLLYSTDGSIISMLKSDPLLKETDIVIIDEAHERKVQIDLLLYLLRKSIVMRKEQGLNPLKLIIMSATINESIFRSYFRELAYDYMFLSGKPNFPIQSIYLENSLNIKSNEYLEKGKQIIMKIVESINKHEQKGGNKSKSEIKFINGDILFFVCTISECERVTRDLSKKLPDCFVMALYSGFDSELEPYLSNPDKFKELNSRYKRRIFVSTNVAESSLTIDGIVYVIDTGLEMGVKYDPERKANVMEKHIITKAQMSQRKGRSGRTKPGICYHLYTPKQEEEAEDFPPPEILKEDMKNLCVSLLKLGSDLNAGNFTVEDTIKMFTDFIEPPLQAYITDGFNFNIDNNIIGPDMKLSKIGDLISETRLDVMDALSLLYAYNISQSVFKEVFKIVCIQSYLKHGINDFFYDNITENQKQDIIQNLSEDISNSEHLLLLNIYEYIDANKDETLFELGLFHSIRRLFSSQITKITKMYEKYNILLENENITKEANSINIHIIHSINYGYKYNRAIGLGSRYIYNNMICDLSKGSLQFVKIPSIIFYTNLFVNNKLNIMICSPYLLEK